MKLLVNTPFITSPAGVSNHYLGLEPYFSDDVVYNQFITGNYIRRKIDISLLHMPLRGLAFIYDLIKFLFLLIIYNRPKVLLNPSFRNKSLKRDEFFLKIGKLLNCKVIVFFHGWDQDYLSKVMSNNKEEFRNSWQKADAFFVLAEEFKAALRKLDIKAPIYLTTTKVDDRLMKRGEKQNGAKNFEEILFLGRVEKEKGIFITLKAFQILNDTYPHLHLTVVGSGSKEYKAKEFAKKNKIKNIEFTGALYGDDLKEKFENADLYVLPTYAEGMPTTVLEAMAFGLPVVTRPVGGLKDFFEDGKMGYLIESTSPEDFANAIKPLIKDTDKSKKISKYNKQYAEQNFLASQVARNLENRIKAI